MGAADLTAARLRELLHYDPETGVFRWRVDAGWAGRFKAGTIVGSENAYGHLVVNLGGTPRYLHRIAFVLMTGEWPQQAVDHIDGNRQNNAWSNLRDVAQRANTENRRSATRGKKSGLPLGVSVDRRDGRIRADITVNGKARSLGRYDTPEEAHAAYLKAKRELHVGNTL